MNIANLCKFRPCWFKFVSGIHAGSRLFTVEVLGCYLSFDLMAELVFGKTFRMLAETSNRFIIDLIQAATFRVGVCFQMSKLAVWNIDKLLSPGVSKLRDRYVEVSRSMAIDRMKMEKANRHDLFSYILAAKDPQTGKGFSMDDIWGESTLLIVAGKKQSFPKKKSLIRSRLAI